MPKKFSHQPKSFWHVWAPCDNPIQSERANSSIMECEEFILPDWSPPDNPARPCRPKAGYGLVMMMMMLMNMIIMHSLLYPLNTSVGPSQTLIHCALIYNRWLSNTESCSKIKRDQKCNKMTKIACWFIWKFDIEFLWTASILLRLQVSSTTIATLCQEMCNANHLVRRYCILLYSCSCRTSESPWVFVFAYL